MSALKRKRGGKGAEAKSKKRVKFAENGGSETNITKDQEQKNEVNIPAPLSMVRYNCQLDINT